MPVSRRVRAPLTAGPLTRLRRARHARPAARSGAAEPRDVPDKRALLLWGLHDIAFRRQELEHWQSALTDTEVHEFEDCGHFLAEEAPERILPLLRDFMRRA